MEKNPSIRLLEETILKALQKNEELSKIWNRIKMRYQTAIEGLHTFPKDLKTNCLVPLTKRAMIPGQLIHTNEVLVGLGAEYFTRISAPRAIEYCNRQIETAERLLKDLAAERTLYETRLLSLDNYLLEEGCDLTEHWTEDRLDNWREKHKTRQKEYYKKLAKERSNKEKDENEEETAENEDEALFNRLDELEIIETMKNELNRTDTEYWDSSSDSTSEDAEQTSDEEILSTTEEKTRETDLQGQPCKTVTFKTILEEEQDKMNYNEEEREKDDEPFRIEFSHSDNTPQFRKSTENEIQSPADIHRVFSKPKSILKKTRTLTDSDRTLLTEKPSTILEEPVEEEEEEEGELPGGSTYGMIVGDVTEKKIDVSKVKPMVQPETRPISKFKKDRLLKR